MASANKTKQMFYENRKRKIMKKDWVRLKKKSVFKIDEQKIRYSVMV